MSVARVLEACRAVAAGSVELQLASRAGRPVGTAGQAPLAAGALQMRGLGVPIWLARGLGPLGFEVRPAVYGPWV